MSNEPPSSLGAFSVSLSVKDLQKSKEFYAKLGFEQILGEEAQGWLILRNGTVTIGLFHGMFEGNILTFNPGWDAMAGPLGEFTDVRDLQRQLKSQGVELMTEADESTTGPASFMLADPDGNTVLIDQHVYRNARRPHRAPGACLWRADSACPAAFPRVDSPLSKHTFPEGVHTDGE
jgi:catechol 2,3-dioxygenase-like lactoylglutathione lyase family enzyme